LQGPRGTLSVSAYIQDVSAEIATIRYRRAENGCGVRKVRVDGQVATGTTLSRGYREGGVSIDAALVQAGAVIDVAVG